MKLSTRADFYVVDSVLDEDTGKRHKAIVRQKSELVQLEEVGSETYYNAKALNLTLNVTIQMRKISYTGEQYIKIDERVYQVTRVGKGITEQYIKLPLVECPDKEVVAVIRDD